jgi:MFS family permease
MAAVFWVRVGITLAVLPAGLYVILSKRYPPADRKWAYGAIGLIMAFWLAAGSL